MKSPLWLLLQELTRDHEILLKYNPKAGVWTIRNPVDGMSLGNDVMLIRAISKAFNSLGIYEEIE